MYGHSTKRHNYSDKSFYLLFIFAVVVLEHFHEFSGHSSGEFGVALMKKTTNMNNYANISYLNEQNLTVRLHIQAI